jgi:hypothetical protein
MAQTKTSTTRGRTTNSNARSRSNQATRNRSNVSSRSSQPTRSRSNASNRSSQATRPRSGASNRSRQATRPRSNARRAQANGRARSVSKSAISRAKSVRDTVTSETQGAARGVASFAKKARGPLLTGGAGVAGVAAAVAVTARSKRRRKVLGITLPRRKDLRVDAQKVTETIAEAARRADRFGQNMSRVASGVQDVSQEANKAAKKS